MCKKQQCVLKDTDWKQGVEDICSKEEFFHLQFLLNEFIN